MRVRYSAFWLPKDGNSFDEYEDAYAPSDLSTLLIESAEMTEFRCAVADGATETSFSGLWAQTLAGAFVSKRLTRDLSASLKSLSADWNAGIRERTKDRPLSWYAEEKLQKGAFSSLTALNIGANGWWHALAVGDSCLFQVRGGSLVRAFPYTAVSDFNNHPALWSTNLVQNTHVKPDGCKGKWKPGDTFLLMTDALACYALGYAEQNSEPDTWRHWLSAGLDKTTFEHLVGAARRNKLCRNDDVTLLRVQVEAGVDGGGLA